MPDFLEHVLWAAGGAALARLLYPQVRARIASRAALRPAHFTELAEGLRELRPQVLAFVEAGDSDAESPSFETRRDCDIDWWVLADEGSYLHLWTVGTITLDSRYSDLLASYIADRLGLEPADASVTLSYRGVTQLFAVLSEEAHRELMSRPIEIPTRSERDELLARLEELLSRLPRREIDSEADEANAE